GARLVRRLAPRAPRAGQLRAPRRAGQGGPERLRLPAHGHVHDGRAREGGSRGRASCGGAALARRLGGPRGDARAGPAPGGGDARGLHRGAVDAAQGRGAKLCIAVVADVARRDGAASGVVTAEGETIEGDVVVLAMGPWTGRLAPRLRLPGVWGLKGYSVT